MSTPEKRFREVSKSEFPHEREGLGLLVAAVPNTAPYRVWTNFSFTDDQGQWHEVDALVVGRGRIHMVELKSWNGVFSGSEHQIDIVWDNGGRAQKRHPNYTTRKKAQKFVGRLHREIDEIRRHADAIGIPMSPQDYYVPWVQECLFLHGDRVHSRLSESGAHNVFGRDGMESQTNLPGIAERLTEGPGKHPITEKRSRDVLAIAIDNIVGANLPARRPKVGDWDLQEVIENDDGFILRSARNPLQGQNGVAYIPDIPANLDPSEKRRREKQVVDTFRLLESLNSDGIDRPVMLSKIDDTDTHVLIYQAHEGFESLDLLPPSLELTAEQQVELILQIADAVAYAHSNNVVHRRLAPASVLVRLRPEIGVKISRWSTVSSADTRTSTATRLSTSTAGAYDGFSVFLPPEGFGAGTDRRLGELFSVGALAYYVFAEKTPANDVPRLLDRLRTDRGLDLAASNATVEEDIRQLVLAATDPNPGKRLERVEALLARRKGRRKSRSQIKDSPVAVFAEAMRAITEERRSDDGTDPLNPTIGGRITERFTVEKVLGVGSTARGLQVLDAEDDKIRVLKVGLSPDKTPSLRAEADAIREVNRALGTARVRRHFVDLVDEPLELPHGRFGLLLSDCGTYTLADMLQLIGPDEENFWFFAEQLMDILVALESTGVVHRDVKPSNLGIVTAGNKRRLMLFDFSLAAAPLDDVSVGSPLYQDPFLVARVGGRTHFDSAAERYSVAVVLLELADRTHPTYGDGGENPATMKDPSLTLAAADLGAFSLPEQREALAAFFRKALAGDHAKRFVTAEEMRAELLSIRKLGASAPVPATPPPPPTPPAPPTPPTPEPVTLRAEITSFATFADEIVAYSGTKGTHSRRYVQHVLGVADTVVPDPFITASPFAKILGCSTPRIHQFPKELPRLWAESEPLTRVLGSLRDAVLESVEATGGIATPAQLEAAVTGVLCDDAASSVSTMPAEGAAGGGAGMKPWPRQGVLRLVELFINSKNEVLHPIRRGRKWHMVAFASTDSLTLLPKALEEAAAEAVSQSSDRLVPEKEVATLLTAAAAAHLEVSASNLPMSPSVLPELATYRSSKVALTPSGELYSRIISLPAMLRNIIRPSTNSIAPASLASSIAARFPAAHNATLPKREQLASLIQDIDPSFTYRDGRYERRSAAASIGVGTKLPTRTRYEGPRDLNKVDPRMRELFVSLDDTIEDRQFRVVSVPLGQTRDVVGALVSQFGAAHVDVAAGVIGDLHQIMVDSGQGDKFDTLLGLDTRSARSDLMYPVRAAAGRVLTAAVHADAPAVVLTDVSILARFDALDQLRPYADITEGGNPRAVWIVVPHERGDDSSVSVEGRPLPLTSPSQFIRFDRPAAR